MTIAIAGATGNLGGRIVQALLEQGATVRALVRSGTDPARLRRLHAMGSQVEVREIDFNATDQVTSACAGATCVVSALLGLREIMVETQTLLLDAAIKAGVPRFIPSDYAMDFTRLQPGSNRNLDLHRDFQQRLDRSGIQATSILNGMFTDLLTGEAPFYLWKIHRVLCWGDPDQKMDFTTMDDTAAFTARAAMDPSAPRWLKVAGDQRSARELAEIAGQVTGRPYKLLRPGGLKLFGSIIWLARRIQPAPHEPFPAWQGMQYMHNMFEGKALMSGLANDRYPGMHWTSIQEVLKRFLATQSKNGADERS